RNRARQDVARMLEEQETEAQRARWEIEARGRATLTEAQNEATSRRRLGKAYRDNRAVLHYELARRRLDVGEKLAEHAPRPVVVRGDSGDSSTLSTLLMSQLLPKMGNVAWSSNGSSDQANGDGSNSDDGRDDPLDTITQAAAGAESAPARNTDHEAPTRPLMLLTWRARPSSPAPTGSHLPPPSAARISTRRQQSPRNRYRYRTLRWEVICSGSAVWYSRRRRPIRRRTSRRSRG